MWPAEWSFDECVSERTIDHCWLRRASIGRCSQMETPGVAVRDRAELAADAVGSVRLGVEALVLRQSAGEEDVDHRARPRAGGSGLLDRVSPNERLEVLHPQPEQADRTGLQGDPAREAGMAGDGWSKRRGCRRHRAPPLVGNARGSFSPSPRPAG